MGRQGIMCRYECNACGEMAVAVDEKLPDGWNRWNNVDYFGACYCAGCMGKIKAWRDKVLEHAMATGLQKVTFGDRRTVALLLNEDTLTSKGYPPEEED